MSHVFISHVEEDADVALEIALKLEEAGYSTWFYELDSIPRPSYLVQTGAAIEQSQAVILVISPNSLGSQQVTREVVRAHESGKYVIPLLRDITHIEFQNRQSEWREALGSATSTLIPKEGIARIFDRIVDGLKAKDIHPTSKPDVSHLKRIRQMLGEKQASSVMKGDSTPESNLKETQKSHDVFICYSSQDITIAESVCNALESRNIQCWIAPRDVLPGMEWAETIVDALDESQVIVLILSSNSNNSPQVIREIGRAAGNGIPIIPFLIDDVSLSNSMDYFISRHQFMYANTPPLEKHLQRFTDTVQRVLETRGWKPKEVKSKQTISSEPAEQKLQIVDTLEVQGASNQGQIQFCVGDLTRLSPEDSIDVLVVSASRNEYFPVPQSLIGALWEKGISVEKLADNKEVDLRQAFSCWISREITDPPPGIHFKRILCYEPSERAKVAELVGDIFRSLAPFLGGQFPVRTVATPLVASGIQGADPANILEILVDAAVNWITAGLPLSCLKIVCTPESNIEALSRLFSELKTHHSKVPLSPNAQFSHDVFISYAHNDVQEVEWFEHHLRECQQNLRMFIDRKNLNPGAAWQRELYESLDDCRKVIAFYSPSYLNSKVCLEEFNIALCRHRDSRESILIPIYLYTAKLPTYMRMVQFLDCREFDREKLNQAISQLIIDISN